MKEVKVWDLCIRIFHWLMVTIVFFNFTFFDEGRVHETLGYILVGLLIFRLLWGFIGSQHARFKDFMPNADKIRHHLKGIQEGYRTFYPGHNPLGALMIFNLLLTLALLCFTGYLATTDIFWGIEWVEEIHEFFADYLLFSIFIHVAGVVWETVMSRVNLIFAMFTGIKKIP